MSSEPRRFGTWTLVLAAAWWALAVASAVRLWTSRDGADSDRRFHTLQAICFVLFAAIWTALGYFSRRRK